MLIPLSNAVSLNTTPSTKNTSAMGVVIQKCFSPMTTDVCLCCELVRLSQVYNKLVHSLHVRRVEIFRQLVFCQPQEVRNVFISQLYLSFCVWCSKEKKLKKKKQFFKVVFFAIKLFQMPKIVFPRIWNGRMLWPTVSKCHSAPLNLIPASALQLV